MTTTQKRPSAARKHTRSTEQRADDFLEHGIALTDEDGSRLVVRLRDVKGSHDARLVAACGMDFYSLLEAMTQRQGLDLFAAALWFARLVNGREAESYTDLLDRFGWENFATLDMDEPKEDAAPKA